VARVRAEEALAERLRGIVRGEIGLDPFDDPEARVRIVEAAERARQAIALDGHAAVTLPALLVTGDGPYHLAVTLFARDMGEGDN